MALPWIYMVSMVTNCCYGNMVAQTHGRFIWLLGFVVIEIGSKGDHLFSL